MHKISTALLTIALTTTPVLAADTSRYSSWQPPAGEKIERVSSEAELQPLLDELTTLIDDAEQARAADRRFIQDLRDVIARYDWPWQTELLYEDFTDGRVDKDRAWIITAGDFKTQRGLGLHSDVHDRVRQPAASSKQKSGDVAAAIFGALLEEAFKGDRKADAEPATIRGETAEIHVDLKLGNAFAINTEIDVRGKQGRMEWGVYQDRPTGSGYRIVFIPGAKGSLELLRTGGRGTRIIESIDNLSIPGDQVHSLQWTRDKNGRMRVSLNGIEVMDVRDRGLRDPFDGFALSNHGGEFAVRTVKISGTR